VLDRTLLELEEERESRVEEWAAPTDDQHLESDQESLEGYGNALGKGNGTEAVEEHARVKRRAAPLVDHDRETNQESLLDKIKALEDTIKAREDTNSALMADNAALMDENRDLEVYKQILTEGQEKLEAEVASPRPKRYLGRPPDPDSE